MRNLGRLPAPCLLLALALGAAACDRPSPAPEPVMRTTPEAGLPGPPAAAGRPSILLVVLDTVRADRFTCYGYTRPTTPKICAAAEAGLLFEQAFANSSWTLPSHASIFTGLYPAAHRATQETLTLADGPATLAEILSAAGYDTWAASANPLAGPPTGLDRGFGVFVETWREELRARYPDHPNNLAFGAFLDRVEDGRPFFAFINYVEAHTFYRPPPDIARRFLAPERTRQEIAAGAQTTMSDHYMRGPLTPRQLAVLGELYDGEVAFLDDLVANLLARLEASGRRRNTLVVITSDHGEHLGEHGQFQHVFSLSDILLRVPLIVLLPGDDTATGLRGDPVQLLDLFPTLLARAGVELPDDGYADLRDGRDLLADGAGAAHRELMAEYYYPRQVLSVMRPDELAARGQTLLPYMRRLRALRRDGLKLVWGSDGRHELYDLATEPGEVASLIDDPAWQAERDRMLADLRERVLRFMGDPPLDPPPPPGWMMPGFEGQELDEDTRERLRSLGYVE